MCLAFAASARAGKAPCYGPRAQMNFLIECAACHQPDGSGSPGTIPSLHDYLGTFAQDPRARFFPSSVSAAANSTLSNAALADVLNWIICTMDAGQIRDGFRPYTADEVGRFRKSPLVDAMSRRDQLLKQMGLAYPAH
jgi:cytochrome c553